jgi:hypothetical protein
MEKLINKFNKIVTTAMFSSNAETAFNSGSIIAEECKKVAIAFGLYVKYRDIIIDDCPDCSTEALFNKFIEEEEYGKQ